MLLSHIANTKGAHKNLKKKYFKIKRLASNFLRKTII